MNTELLINLKLTMESGQPPQFIWNKEDEHYFRYINGVKCILFQDNELNYTPIFKDYIMEFLRSNDDLYKIYKKIATDKILKKSIKIYNGLRITKNDPWETLVSFVCSINNNIPRISKNVQSLMINGEIISPEQILKTDLRPFKLGYRRNFLKKIGEMMPSYNLSTIGKMDYPEAKSTLMEFPGVGNKVSDCILLFGYGFLEAFPLDVWMQRAMKKYYGISKPNEMNDYAKKNWGKYAGYAQQYLYCAIRGV